MSQDVFYAAASSWHTYDPAQSRPERWLNKITVHIAAHWRDQAYHRRMVVERGSPLMAAPDPSADVDARLDGNRVAPALWDLLDTLPKKLRNEVKLLIAHDIDEVPMEDLAKQYRIPLSTAYKWRARAMAALAASPSEDDDSPRAIAWRKARAAWEAGEPEAPDPVWITGISSSGR